MTSNTIVILKYNKTIGLYSDNPIAYNNTSITNVNGAKLWTGSSEYSNYVFDAMFARLVYDYNYKYVLSGSVRRDRPANSDRTNAQDGFIRVHWHGI